MCAPSTGLEDVIDHIEALTTFISFKKKNVHKALTDNNRAISLLNSEISMMRKAVLHNCKALDTLQHLREICAIIHSECYIFIPDKSFNVTHLMNHMRNQISALSVPFPSLDLF